MRRLNVKLALWLVGIMLVLVVGVHFLHGYQLDRNADYLLLQAEEAKKAGDSKEAVKHYNQYLKYRDDPKGYSDLAELVATSAEGADATKRDVLLAYNILEEAIRRHPDLNDVRRRLVDFTMRVGRIPDTLEHIQYLKDRGASDPKLELKIAQCHLHNGEEDAAIKKLYELVGFDADTQKFKAEGGPGAKEIEVFELLAQRLRRKSDGAERADEVMNQLVVLNPDSPKAHLARAQYLSVTSKSMDAAEENLKQAYSLAKEDADVMLAMAAFSMNAKDYPKAQGLLDEALEKYPERQDVYVRLAQLANTQNDYKKGIEYLQQGAAKCKEVDLIMPMLLEAQFQINDLQGAAATCDDVEKRGTFAPEFVRFTRARLKLADGNYWEASREFESMRPSLARNPNPAYAQQLDLFLGRCYENLGLFDRQLDVARRVLRSNPAQAGARLSEATALQALGRHEEAATALEMLVANVDQYPMLRTPVLQLLINDRMAKPADQRDWAPVEKMAGDLYKESWRTEMDNLLLKAELLMAQDKLKDARAALAAARSKDAKDVRVYTSMTKLLQKENRPGDVTKLIDVMESAVGAESPTVRAMRIRQLAQQGGDEAIAGVEKIEKSLDQAPEAERVRLMMPLGVAYLQLKKPEGTKRCWKYIVDHDEKNAHVRQLLFELMVDTKDEAGVKEVLDSIGKSKNFGVENPLYKYCSAVALLRKVVGEGRKQSEGLTDEDQKAVDQARRLIEEAVTVRPEWAPLWRVRAEIEHVEGNVDAAIENYQRALQVSQVGQRNVARRLVQLLMASRRFSEANEALKHVGELSEDDPLKKADQFIYDMQGDYAKALEMAEADVKADPKNPANHILYARQLERAGRPDEAQQAYRQAVEVAPSLEQAWLYLVRHLVANKKTGDAVEVIRDAGTKLGENPTALGQLHELVGDLEQAEILYKEAHEKKPDDIVAVRRLVQFYLKTARDGPPAQFLAQINKAVPYLDVIVKKTESASDAASVRNLGWARRTQAEIMAVGGDYQDLQTALKLIQKNAKNGKLMPDDLVMMIELLSKRSDPHSRNQTIKLLEQLSRQRPLNSREQLLLGQMYERAGNWTQARDLMVSALSSQNNDPETLLAFARSLIIHDENEDAGRWLDQLDELLSRASPRTLEQYKPQSAELRARMLFKLGRAEQAIEVLEQLVPKPLPPSQLYRLEHVSRILEEMEQYDAAERKLDEYLQQEPRGTIAMAAFLGRRGKLDRSFALLDEARKNQSAIEVMPCALESLRLYPEQKTPERCRTLETWGKAALEAEPNSAQIKLLLAELYDLQGRYDDVVKLYREVLADKSTNEMQSAIVKNNLAFVLALTGQDPAEAMKLIGESIQVIGPNSDLLDTRGLANLAQGNVQQAVADFRLAATEAPSVSKYVHLAQAEKQANNMAGARDAMARADKLGIQASRFTPKEKENYEKLMHELQ